MVAPGGLALGDGVHRLVARGTRWLDSTLGFVSTGTAFVALVMLPGLVAPFFADNRLTLFQFEARLGSNPLRVFDFVIQGIPGYLDRGNFRPVSRLQYALEYWGLFKTSYLTGVPGYILHAIPKLAVIAAMLWVCHHLIRQYAWATWSQESGYWKTLRWSFVALLGLFLVLKPVSQHPIILFPGLYLGGVVFALGIAAVMGRVVRVDDRRVGMTIGGVVLGVMVAMMIETAYVAVPLVVAHVILLLVARHGWRHSLEALRRSAGWPMMLAVLGGFSAVFIPIRIIIARICSDGSCYAASAPEIDGDTLGVFAIRLVSPLLLVGESLTSYPPITGGAGMEATMHGLVVCFMGFLLLAQAVIRRSVREQAVPSGWFFVGIFGAIGWLFGGLLGGLSELVELGRVDVWRDTALLWPGLALVGAVPLSRVLVINRLTGLLLSVVIAALVFSPVSFNDRRVLAAAANPTHVAHMRVDTAMAQFDDTPRGRRYRCRLLTELTRTYDGDPSKLDTMVAFLQRASVRSHGEPFCPVGLGTSGG